VSEYLGSGVRVAVVVDPASASTSVYRADELQQIFHNGDELTLPDVLPGFSAPVKSLFA
jgi:Uma2 family endonuclease